MDYDVNKINLYEDKLTIHAMRVYSYYIVQQQFLVAREGKNLSRLK